MAIVLPLVITAVAAVFAYFATLVVKRHEVTRSVALEIDERLQGALLLATIDDPETEKERMDQIIAMTSSAEARTLGLPQSVRSAIRDQILVADALASLLYPGGHPFGLFGLQLAIRAARETLSPLLQPPPLLWRSAGLPESFPSRSEYARLLTTHGDIDKVLDDAIERVAESTLRDYNDLFPLREPPPGFGHGAV